MNRGLNNKKYSYLMYYTNAILHISNYTLVPFIRHMNTTIRQLKTGRIELILIVGSLHISLFLLHTSPFSTGHTCRIVRRKIFISTDYY
jgi:hypothetical protein